jgi:hypothetical protein
MLGVVSKISLRIRADIAFSVAIDPTPTSARALTKNKSHNVEVKPDGRFVGLTAGWAKGPSGRPYGSRLIVSGVAADHGERQVPGVADIDDRQ